MDKKEIASKYIDFITDDISRSKDFSEVDGFIYNMVEEGLAEPEEMDDILSLINDIEFDLTVL